MSTLLRVGRLADIYYKDILGTGLPSQLTILAQLYPGLLIREIPSDGNTKSDSCFDDAAGMICAVVYHGKYYTGYNSRVSQIAARLTGTARGGIEKERRTASDIQNRIARQLAEDPDSLIALWNYHADCMEGWTDEILDRAVECITDYSVRLSTEEPSEDELFPMDSEVKTQLGIRIQKRLEAEIGEGLIDAWIWILLGALLRNEIRRLLYRYRADFSLYEEETPSRSSENTVSDAADDYEYYYEGDDMEKRFPGIEWYCDRCNERLDLQEGFHDFVHIWKCANCGFKNRIEVDEIYDSKQDYLAGNAASDRQKIFRALKERTDELDKQE